MGKKTPSAITATLGGSPMPSHRMRSGRSAIFGIGKVAAMTGMTTASARLEKPTAMPTTIPASAPMAKPRASRRRLEPR